MGANPITAFRLKFSFQFLCLLISSGRACCGRFLLGANSYYSGRSNRNRKLFSKNFKKPIDKPQVVCYN